MQRLIDGPATVNVLATPEPSTIITGLVPGLVYEFTVRPYNWIVSEICAHLQVYNNKKSA